ncbi:hypothetical protein LB507_008564 [Fusarium sp. FIESC RH6]|nr:hypothetical protein LB507_008564 [Fusarium sp. FIESC RH6]
MDERELELLNLSIHSGEISPSEGTLCDKCLAISWKPDDIGHRQVRNDTYEWTLDHHEKFKDLEASCEAGCPLCQTMFLLLTYDGLGSGESDPLHWELEFDGDLWHLKFQTPKPEDVNVRLQTVGSDR